VHPGAFQTRMAVVDDDREDGDTAQTLQLWDVGGEPGGAMGAGE